MKTSDSAPLPDNQEPGSSTQGASDQPALKTVEICTGEQPTAAVLWLHGLGADGHDFEPIVPHLSWPGAPAVRYVFPHAPVRPVTLNGGMPMRAWYDIVSLDAGREHDVEGIEGSVLAAARLVEREMERGIAPDRIIIAGFSQGGAIATLTALRFGHSLAGLVVLSSYLLFANDLKRARHSVNHELPVFVGHGTLDPLVPVAMGREVATRLEGLGHPVTWHSYEVPHTVCPDEIADLTAWLRQQLD